jgi:hypothetical protein
MYEQVTSDQIAELTCIISTLALKQTSLTDEEYELLKPILDASGPLMNALDQVLMQDAVEELEDVLDEEEEDWS